MLDFLNSIFTHLTILANNIPDLKPIGQVIIDAANKILATIFVILGVGVGWWSIISLIKIAKDRNESEDRANHIQGLQWMFGPHQLDLNHEEQMLLQSLLNTLDNIQHYHLLLSLAKDNQQKINYQEQITLWQNKAKDLQLALVPILLALNC